jgi:hypothetical protein
MKKDIATDQPLGANNAGDDTGRSVAAKDLTTRPQQFQIAVSAQMLASTSPTRPLGYSRMFEVQRRRYREYESRQREFSKE